MKVGTPPAPAQPCFPDDFALPHCSISFTTSFEFVQRMPRKFNFQLVNSAVRYGRKVADRKLMRIILWFILLVLCWPLAIALLFLYPLIWLLLLPFRLLGIAVEGVFRFIAAIFMLPARILGR